MTVTTHHDALGNLALGRSEALAVANAANFSSSNVVEVKSRRMLPVSASHATRFHFLFFDPSADAAIMFSVDEPLLFGIPSSPLCQSFALPNSPSQSLSFPNLSVVRRVFFRMKAIPFCGLCNKMLAMPRIVRARLSFYARWVPIAVSLISFSVKKNCFCRHRRNTITCL